MKHLPEKLALATLLLDDDVDNLPAARRNFRRYGVSISPEEMGSICQVAAPLFFQMKGQDDPLSTNYQLIFLDMARSYLQRDIYLFHTACEHYLAAFFEEASGEQQETIHYH
ncbi:MAG TPA: hypothetical protein VJI15_04940 [Candidatus Nanoarchaeia archaeon]|nr:hypothetical protein [Candidatus Nanoarchaeia archaeon]